MTDRVETQVIDRDGRSGQALLPAVDEPNGRVLVRLEDGTGLLIDRAALESQSDGGFRTSLSFEELAATASRAESDAVVIPVIEEEVTVEKREVERGRVRISKTVSERDVLVDQPLLHEHVDVVRVPVNQMVDAPPEVRHEGDTMIVPVLEEVVVVEIRLMVREEIRITRRREEVHEPQEVTLRREEVTVDRISDDGETLGDANNSPA